MIKRHFSQIERKFRELPDRITNKASVNKINLAEMEIIMKKRKVIHYGKKFTVLVCVALTLTITGCSEKSEESGVMVS